MPRNDFGNPCTTPSPKKKRVGLLPPSAPIKKKIRTETKRRKEIQKSKKEEEEENIDLNNNNNNDDDDNICSICLEEFKNDFYVVAKGCKHKHCVTCLVGWLDRNHSCPKCRAPCGNEFNVFVVGEKKTPIVSAMAMADFKRNYLLEQKREGPPPSSSTLSPLQWNLDEDWDHYVQNIIDISEDEDEEETADLPPVVIVDTEYITSWIQCINHQACEEGHYQHVQMSFNLADDQIENLDITVSYCKE